MALFALLRLVPNWLWGALLALLLVCGAAAWQRDIGFRRGAAAVQAKWDAERMARDKAERQAMAQRADENMKKAAEDRARMLDIERKHRDEITQIQRRAVELADQRLRINVPAAVCAGAAGSTEADRAAVSAGAATRTIALPEQIERDLRALMVEADTVVAHCRAAQDFITENGFDKE